MFSYFLISILQSVKAAPLLSDRADTPESPLLPNRTLFSISWSCVSTIIICAWTSVHPNVPPPNKWKARWNRLRLMFWMIIAPELVLAWAVRQFFAARQIRDEYNQSRPELPEWKKWTLIHGHLVGMGGITFVDPEDEDKDPNEVEQRSRVLTLEELRRLLNDRNFKFPFIRATAIQDRSKGDALWKVIAILQTSWFILQCIARGQQRLALTELELVTLALASLNAVTFAIWWHKPLGVQEPVMIYLKVKDSSTSQPRIAEHGAKRFDLSFKDVLLRGWEFVVAAAIGILYILRNPNEYGPISALFDLFIVIPADFSYIITFPFFVLFPLAIVLLLRIIETEPAPQEIESAPQETVRSRGVVAARIVSSLQQLRYSLSSTTTKFVEGWLEQIFAARHTLSFTLGWFFLLPSLFLFLVLFSIFLTPFLAFLFLVSFVFTAVFSIVTTSTIQPGASHVPSFYAPKTNSDRWSRMIVFALFGVIFGGLHCIGWNFEFPTHSEQTLWRGTSLTITFIPLIVAPIDFLLVTWHDINSFQGFKRTLPTALDLIMTILLFIYVPARLSLIAQALALLRAQPSTALVAVDWTKYIPHLFS